MLTKSFSVWKYSHHFVVVCRDSTAIANTRRFVKRFVEYVLTKSAGKFTEKPERTYARANAALDMYRIHINALDQFISHMSMAYGIHPQLVVDTIEEIPMYKPPDIKIGFKEGWVDKEEQVEPIRWGLDQVDAGKRSVVYIWQMGYGKSYMTTRVALKAGGRIVMMIQPIYSKKWKLDFLKMLDVGEDDVLFVNGSGKLLDLVNADPDTLPPVIMISINTIMDWFNLYDDNNYKPLTDFGYNVDPPCLMEHLGAGALMRDEVHEQFHNMFYIDLFTHVPITVSATATMESESRHTVRMMEVMFPSETRNVQTTFNRFTDIHTAKYSLADVYRIKTTLPRCAMHSQIAVEKSLLNNKYILDAYCDFVIRLIKEHYVDRRQDGDHCIVYQAFRLFLDQLYSRVVAAFPGLTVAQYKSGEDYNNLIGVDISLTTKKSAGTGVDVPNLIAVIDGDLKKSVCSVRQSVGRPREQAGVTPRYVRMVCTDWDKHLYYWKRGQYNTAQYIRKEHIHEYGMIGVSKHPKTLPTW